MIPGSTTDDVSQNKQKHQLTILTLTSKYRTLFPVKIVAITLSWLIDVTTSPMVEYYMFKFKSNNIKFRVKISS